jgi:hypothetical protein
MPLPPYRAPPYRPPCTAQHVVLWAKLHWYARVLSPQRSSFVDSLRLVIGDVRWFLGFMAFTMTSFGFAFYCLYAEASLVMLL